MIWFDNCGAVPVKMIWLLAPPSAEPCATRLSVAPTTRPSPVLLRITVDPRPAVLLEVIVELPVPRLIVPRVSVTTWPGVALPLIVRLELFSDTFGLLAAPRRLLIGIVLLSS